MRERFIEFARLKLAADGSDSYIMGAVETALRLDDPYWYLGVFTTFYAPPAQDVFGWTRAGVLGYPWAVEEWVTNHWRDIPLSGARRTGAFTPQKVMTALTGYGQWLEEGGPKTLDTSSFDSAFTGFLKRVPYHGRYTGLKLYESLRRIGAPLPVVDDIRPRGGRTPRRGLQLVFGHDPKPDDTSSLREANELADELRRAVPTTWFNIEMLLCNFSKAIKGSYYPGHALDRELSRMDKALSAFSSNALNPLREVRYRLYPHECLGEVSGWNGGRKELERTYPEHNYLWSDLRYDYRATTDLQTPVHRPFKQLRALHGYGEEETA